MRPPPPRRVYGNGMPSSAGAIRPTGAEVDVASGNLTFNDSGVLTAGGERGLGLLQLLPGGEPEPEDSARIRLRIRRGHHDPVPHSFYHQLPDPGRLRAGYLDERKRQLGGRHIGPLLQWPDTQPLPGNPRQLQQSPGGLPGRAATSFQRLWNSGVAYTNTPGSAGLGNINANSLEQSNVDLRHGIRKDDRCPEGLPGQLEGNYHHRRDASGIDAAQEVIIPARGDFAPRVFTVNSLT